MTHFSFQSVMKKLVSVHEIILNIDNYFEFGKFWYTIFIEINLRSIDNIFFFFFPKCFCLKYLHVLDTKISWTMRGTSWMLRQAFAQNSLKKYNERCAQSNEISLREIFSIVCSLIFFIWNCKRLFLTMEEGPVLCLWWTKKLETVPQVDTTPVKMKIYRHNKSPKTHRKVSLFEVFSQEDQIQ